MELKVRHSAVAVASADCSGGSFEIDRLHPGNYEVTIYWGIQRYSEQIALMSMREDVTFRIPTTSAAPSEQTISVAEMQIPKRAKEEFQKANESMQKQNWQKADHQISEVLKLAPNFGKALALRATLLLIRHDFRSALDVATTAVSHDPSLPMAQFLRASALNALGEPKLAEVAAEQGIRMRGNDWQGHFELAKSLVAQNDFRTALIELNRAAETAPKNIADLFFMKAWVLFRLRDLSQSEENLSEFSRLRPGDARATKLQALLASAAH